MTEVTSNGIVKWTNRDPVSLVQESQEQGDSIELALSKRERYDFVWANSAERTAQTGMVQGSRGYQIDTKTEYLYDSSSWRLETPFIQFNTSVSVPDSGGSPTLIGTLTVNPSASTDTTIATNPSSGVIRIVNPGIYAISYVAAGPVPTTGRSFAEMYFSATIAYIDFKVLPTGENMIFTLNSAALRTSTANVDISIRVFQTSGAARTVAGTLSLCRLG